MEITEVRITLRDEGRLRAFASITFDNWFVVRGLKIIESTNGTFVAMPSRKRGNGEYQDIAHPISREAREWLESAVIAHADAPGEFELLLLGEELVASDHAQIMLQSLILPAIRAPFDFIHRASSTGAARSRATHDVGHRPLRPDPVLLPEAPGISVPSWGSRAH
mgnify:CR=1 FL=1